MKNAFYICKRDLLRIWKNKIAVIVIIGVCIIPSLYAWFNIAANMDPYANTRRIQVAIVSEDESAAANGTTINAGKDIVKNLKKNKKLNWRFVNRKNALEGVKSGRYYAAIIIPKDFSRDLLSITSGNMKAPSLEYYVNEKKNAIAPKITSTGASTLQEQIDETFSSVAAKTASRLLKDSAGVFYEDVNTSKKTLGASLGAINKNFDSYSTNLEAFKASATDTKKQLSDISRSLETVRLFARSGKTSLDTADSLAKTTRAASGALVTDILDVSSKNMGYLTDFQRTASQSLNGELDKIHSVNTRLDSQLSSLSEIIAANESLLKRLEKEDHAFPGLFADTIADLKAQNATLKAVVTALQAKSAALSAKAEKLKTSDSHLGTLVNDLNGTLSASGKTVSETVNTKLAPSLDGLMTLSGQMLGTLDSLPGTLSLTQNVLAQTQNALSDAVDALSKTDTLVKAIQTDLDQMTQDLAVLEGSKAFKNLFSLKALNTGAIGSFIASPVKMRTTALYPVKNYGSAMAPFYTNLALWVGGIVLVSVIKLEVDTDDRLVFAVPSHTYMGRLFLLVLLSILQGLIVTAGDIWLLKIQCVHPGRFILAGILCAVTFTNVIFSLAITFKHIGKALCVLFIILQIPGGSGTYPIEMTPPFFQKLHPLLPFTYGISAMREAIAGLYADTYWSVLIKLMIFLPLSLLVGLFFRPLLLNINNLFDTKLQETDLMISEHNTLVRRKPQIDLLIKALIRDDAISQELEKRKAAFERTYKKKVRRGLIVMCTLPLVFLLLMFFIRAKSVCLILWIISMIATAIYLIVLEYINHKFAQENAIRDMSRDEIIDEIREGKNK